MNNYQCDKCFTFIENEGNPSSYIKCPEGSHHFWKNLGAMGNINYQCNKCSKIIKSQSNPVSNGKCSEGSYHNWKKL